MKNKKGKEAIVQVIEEKRSELYKLIDAAVSENGTILNDKVLAASRELDELLNELRKYPNVESEK